MTSELVVQTDHVKDLHFVSHAREHELHLDYSLDPQVGAKNGATPLETLLAALATCSASTLNLLFKSQKIPVSVTHVEAKGQRQDRHPTVLHRIDLEFVLSGSSAETAPIDAVLNLAAEQICPVWVMIKCSAEIHASYRFEPA